MAEPDVSLAWSTQQELSGRTLARDSESEVSFEGEESDHIPAPQEGAFARRDGSVASIGTDSSLGLSAAGSSSDTVDSQNFDEFQEESASPSVGSRSRRHELPSTGMQVGSQSSVSKQQQRKQQDQSGIAGKVAQGTRRSKPVPNRLQYEKSPKAQSYQEEREDGYSFGEEDRDEDAQAMRRQRALPKHGSRRQHMHRQRNSAMQRNRQQLDAHVNQTVGEPEAYLRDRNLPERSGSLLQRDPEARIYLDLADAELSEDEEESLRFHTQRSSAERKEMTPSRFLQLLEQKFGGYTRAFDTMCAQAVALRPRGMAMMTKGAALDPGDFEIACERLELLGPDSDARDLFAKLDFDGGKANTSDNCLTIVDILNADRELRSTGSARDHPRFLGLRLFWPEYTSSNPAMAANPTAMFAGSASTYERQAMSRPLSSASSPLHPRARSPDFGGSPGFGDSLGFGSTGFTSAARITPTAFRHPAGPRRLRAG